MTDTEKCNEFIAAVCRHFHTLQPRLRSSLTAHRDCDARAAIAYVLHDCVGIAWVDIARLVHGDPEQRQLWRNICSRWHGINRNDREKVERIALQIWPALRHKFVEVLPSGGLL